MKPVEYYRKNADGTLELIAQEDLYQNRSFPVGHTLVTVKKNSTQYRYQVNPDTVALVAAAESLKSQLADMLYQASQSRLDLKQKYTPEQMAAWRHLQASGVERLWSPSSQEVADRFLEALCDRAHAATQLPWVQDAQERYQQALALSLQNHE